jgi:hypothetical protein
VWLVSICREEAAISVCWRLQIYSTWSCWHWKNERRGGCYLPDPLNKGASLRDNSSVVGIGSMQGGGLLSPSALGELSAFRRGDTSSP